jgi:hypothetical protein
LIGFDRAAMSACDFGNDGEAESRARPRLLPAPGELRFDMYEGEFTHEGDHCTFEVLVARAGLTDPVLAAIGEIVHDIDLKDAKFARVEASGIASVIDSIAAANKDDERRLGRGAAVLDDLYELFRRKR